MTTSALIQSAGVVALIAVLIAALLVVVLRLAALPLAGTALALDALSTVISRRLPAMPVRPQHPHGGVR